MRMILAVLAVFSTLVVPAVADTASSAVLISRSGGLGSGVYIGNALQACQVTGCVVTAAHVVAEDDGSKKSVDRVFVTVSRNDEPAESVGAKVIGFDPREDIALLKLDISVPDLSVAALACRAPKVGESIEVVGNPFGMTFIHTWGHVSGVMRDLHTWPHGVPVDVSIAPGNSGGPVYDKDGKVLGLAIGLLAKRGEDGKLESPGVIGIMVSSLPICQHLGLGSDEVVAKSPKSRPSMEDLPAKFSPALVPAAECVNGSVATLLENSKHFTVQKFEGEEFLKYFAAAAKVIDSDFSDIIHSADALYVVLVGDDVVFDFLAKGGCIINGGKVKVEVHNKILDAMKASGSGS